MINNNYDVDDDDDVNDDDFNDDRGAGAASRKVLINYDDAEMNVLINYDNIYNIVMLLLYD